MIRECFTLLARHAKRGDVMGHCTLAIAYAGEVLQTARQLARDIRAGTITIKDGANNIVGIYNVSHGRIVRVFEYTDDTGRNVH